ncbi:hypothetical protein Nepgr_006472 [Nepenthes gracilis]|uniref:Uncharacterized protein n=1 Tax=Nepenthes gracilis TaxID=150966 RepID=A0AAD3XHD2_NEPGR|nr:hypothetical protein Nepgr_006472 [Nepenthes gracilis]
MRSPKRARTVYENSALEFRRSKDSFCEHSYVRCGAADTLPFLMPAIPMYLDHSGIIIATVAGLTDWQVVIVRRLYKDWA